MGKQIGTMIFLIVAVGFLGYRLWSCQHRESAEKRFKRQWEENQASQEIVCDNCSETTTGLSLNRTEVLKYQVCPVCKQRKARAVVYYFCQNPACDRQLIRVRNSVWEGRSLPGDPVICPKCHRGNDVIPDYLNLKSAERIAKETGQEFP